MSKIIFLANDWFALYNYRKDLMAKLVNDGNEVFACVIEDEGNYKLEELGVKVIVVPMERRGTNPIKDFSVFKKYDKIMRKIKPDVVIAYTIKPCIYGGWAARKNKIPFIATITGLGTAFQSGKFMKFLVVNMYRFAFKKAKYVFFQNDDNMNVFLENKIIKNSQIVRVNGSGVDLERFKYLEYPKNEINFLFVSRILKEKGIDQYLETAEYIKSKYDNVNFYIIGKVVDEEYNEILKDYEKNGVVKYEGQQSDMVKYQKISSCTVHPTYYPEGMSNVLLESLASGRPIITTDVCGCKEILEDGINGFLVEKKSTESLKEVVEKFIDLPIEAKIKLGQNGREKVEEKFDRKSIIDKYFITIKGLLGD